MNCDLLCRQQATCDASGYLSLPKAHDTNPQYHLGIPPVSPSPPSLLISASFLLFHRIGFILATVFLIPFGLCI
jgi:hypothetical protein